MYSDIFGGVLKGQKSLVLILKMVSLTQAFPERLEADIIERLFLPQSSLVENNQRIRKAVMVLNVTGYNKME